MNILIKILLLPLIFPLSFIAVMMGLGMDDIEHKTSYWWAWGQFWKQYWEG